MDANELTSKAIDDVAETEGGNGEGAKANEDSSELSPGKGWSIPDGDSPDSSTQEDVECESSKDGSQMVYESMFTDSDGGSTIKMNGQW
jgi:hypothetical protein